MTSPRQLDANRRNSERSTGPTSPEGREASSRNATTHGMTATKPADQGDARRIRVRLEAWRHEPDPEGPQQESLAEEVVTASVRVDRCRGEEQAWRERQAIRA